MARDDSDNSGEEEEEAPEIEIDYHLTGDQKKAAKKLTQIADSKDANAAYKERSEIREQYFTMSCKVQEATRELKETGRTELMNTDEGFTELEGIVKTSKMFYDKVGASTKEVACDARLLTDVSHLALAGAAQLHNIHVDKVLRPKEFAERIVELSKMCSEEPIKLISSDPAMMDLLNDSDDEEDYRPKNAKRRLPDGMEDDGEIPATAWAAFGRKFGNYLKLVPTLTYFRPLLHDTAPLPQQPKAKKERMPKDEKSKAKAIVLSEKDKNHDDPDQSVTRELDCIRKSLRREVKRTKSRVIPYYWFVIDPHDFSKSVENMFYTSFLVKDNHIRIEIDLQKGIPMIVVQGVEGDEDGHTGGGGGGATTSTPSTRADAAAVAGANCESTQQAIIGFAYDIWEGMIDCLNITEAVIRR